MQRLLYFFSIGIVAFRILLAQRTFEPDVPAPVNEAIDSARIAKAQAHRVQNEQFLSSVDNFHAERNTTIESSMESVLQTYRAANKAQPQPSK